MYDGDSDLCQFGSIQGIAERLVEVARRTTQNKILFTELLNNSTIIECIIAQWLSVRQQSKGYYLRTCFSDHLKRTLIEYY